MILTKKIIYTPNKSELTVLEILALSSAKLWNIANYEKRNYKSLDFSKFPDWYEQKKRLKDEFWYKNLPSQTAQNTLDVLHKSWKSFFALKRTGGVKNPQPPRFKKDKFNFSYLNKGFKVISDDIIRFSISKQLKEYLWSEHSIDFKFLTLKIKNFSKVSGIIKTIEFKPLLNDKYQINIVYEIPDVDLKPDNNHYLSIDIGIKNLFTCYDNEGKSFIINGAKYLEVSQYFNKEISYYQKIAHSQQVAEGSKYGKNTKRIDNLYIKKNLQLNHFFHSATKKIVDYCVISDISKVVIGDIKGIRKGTNFGKITNQKIHSFPYEKIYSLLSYKLRMNGIELIKQKENYSSQVSPFALLVNKDNANKSNRKYRGLYSDRGVIFNADSVGAFNILRLYEQRVNRGIKTPLKGLSNPAKINVSV